ncbi:NAD(P)H-dependent oxidoreductase [Thiohalobacter sp. IOR34]|uniref:NADPH-dependent FMN reductase n=1 Tax=Thiohalobacter sp. IOR34 TaxID=3057176 RepID=UPI0025B1EC66|nr:NAD(P)H-dependent oxidoreductase [Thiohalobacter sp. IOR34]WJW75414.1 NAD(P)H-dependent oxidoreductase [Thiohalobacter sp. IOR34]
MKISIISGSHRDPSQSMKVARFIEQRLRDKGLCDQTWLYALANNPLPLWDQGVWDGDEDWTRRLDPLHAELRSSDGFVIVTPEWHGQVPAGLKNFFLLCGATELGHKPALIVSVSSADGGAYPVAELRMSSYKNNRLCYIPEQVIVRHVESVLNEDPAANDPQADPYFRARIDWALGILREYALALRQVRKSGVTESEQFRNGM